MLQQMIVKAQVAAQLSPTVAFDKYQEVPLDLLENIRSSELH